MTLQHQIHSGWSKPLGLLFDFFLLFSKINIGNIFGSLKRVVIVIMQKKKKTIKKEKRVEKKTDESCLCENDDITIRANKEER